jgi:hypothetical protein
MANYFLHVGRGKGSRATKAAAYRAGERIRDERTSAVYNYTDRTDVAHAEIVLPTEYADHEPRPHADHRHHHAHLLMTTREVGPNGLGARTTLDLSGTERHARGLGPSVDELLWKRERWAQVTNSRGN